jgi:hypothetical protein
MRTQAAALCVPRLVVGLGCNSHLCVSDEYSIRSLDQHAFGFRNFLLRNLGISHDAVGIHHLTLVQPRLRHDAFPVSPR